MRWMRWGHWSAHLFNEGGQMCRTVHGKFVGFDPTAKPPVPAELTPNGLPYGRVCPYCLKHFWRRPDAQKC